MAASKKTLAITAGLVGVAAIGAVLALSNRSEPQTVVLVVLDTVRADHLSACGYGRETSPTLDRLVEAGAHLTCQAYSPGDWTLPSHASYFTGLTPLEHRAHTITSGIDDFSGGGNRSRPLEGPMTLAERMVERGYSAQLLSGNPLINETMGLERGFQRRRLAKGFRSTISEDFLSVWLGLVQQVQEEVPEGPHFFFVNLADAHQPWDPVGPEVAWQLHDHTLPYRKTTDDSMWSRFIRDELDPLDEQLVRERARDLYDYAVFVADRHLGELVSSLEAQPWCEDEPCLLIVTSDHGEFLGEYQLLDHGSEVFEENVRVPLLITEVGPNAQPERLPELPSPISAMVVHDLVLTGELPDPLPPVVSMAFPHARRCARTHGHGFCSISVATWFSETEKLLWRDGAYYDVDLGRDGSELESPPADPPGWFEELALQVKQDERDDADVSQDVIEMLKAAGYLD